MSRKNELDSKGTKRKEHWEALFNRVDYTQVFWHQTTPDVSLSLIEKHTTVESEILDVGCGASFLVDKLLEKAYKNISLLDISQTSLHIVKERINNDKVVFMCSDILNFKTNKKFDIWHDRAVFHFLLTKEEQTQYFETLMKHLKKNGIAFISTFATHGDISCAGLDTIQYDKEKMLQVLPLGLKLMKSNEFLHYTPKNTTQKYISFIIEKV